MYFHMVLAFDRPSPRQTRVGVLIWADLRDLLLIIILTLRIITVSRALHALPLLRLSEYVQALIMDTVALGCSSAMLFDPQH